MAYMYSIKLPAFGESSRTFLIMMVFAAAADAFPLCSCTLAVWTAAAKLELRVCDTVVDSGTAVGNVITRCKIGGRVGSAVSSLIVGGIARGGGAYPMVRRDANVLEEDGVVDTGPRRVAAATGACLA